jgi:hypothetical protein
MKPIPLSKLQDSGLIFEINRQILNPLGMMLEVRRDASNVSNPVDTLVLYESPDSEGILFTPESFSDGVSRFNLYMKKEGEARVMSRMKTTGFLRQTRSDQ